MICFFVEQKYQILKLIKKIKWLVYHNVQDLYFCYIVINVTKTQRII